MSQPEWQLIGNLGDVSADFGNLDYGALYLYEDSTGVYPPEAELVEVPDSDREPCYVYRFILEPCTYVDGILSDNRFHPDHPAWFADNLESVAVNADITVAEFIRLITSSDTRERAHAWREIGEYHGFENLDSYPLKLSRSEIDARYAHVSLNR